MNYKNKYETQEEFNRKWISNKIDMERIGSIIDERLNKLFKEQEFSSNKIIGIKALLIFRAQKFNPMKARRSRQPQMDNR